MVNKSRAMNSPVMLDFEIIRLVPILLLYRINLAKNAQCAVLNPFKIDYFYYYCSNESKYHFSLRHSICPTNGMI